VTATVGTVRGPGEPESDQDDTGTQWGDASPLALVKESVSVPAMRTEGSVRYLLASGARDGGSFGVIGAFWVSDDGQRGGFLVSPQAIYAGSEMVRSYRGALRRGWTHDRIFEYWRGRAGLTEGALSIDRRRRAETLLQLHQMISVL
jgi:hypothetical protein